MENTTVVTALYNIQRETQGDGRSWEEYLEWFRETLQIPLPMIIYIPVELEPFIIVHRPNHYKTKIIIQELLEIPYACYEKQMQQILDNPIYQSKIKDPMRIECRMPFYNIIQYSKFQWIKKAIEENSFQSTYFFWMDAGISRFIPKEVYERTLSFVNLPRGQVILQNNHVYYHYPVDEKYLWDSQCLLCGTMFGGDQEAMMNIATIIDKALHTRLGLGWINNEQILLAYLQRCICPSLFYLIFNNSNKHLCLYEKCFI